MQQLSGLDTAFLNLETAAVPLHVGSVSIIAATAEDGTPVGYDQIAATLQARLHLLPPFRWKLAQVPLGLDHPYWVDDPDFDLEFHLRENALPAPGTDAQLAELVARIHARKLDRARPLWEMHVISGLASGDVAVYTKMHHAAIDGVSGAEIMTVLLDLAPTPAGVVPHDRTGPAPVPVPRRREVLGRAGLNLVRLPLRVAETATRTAVALPYLGGMVRGALPGLRGDGLLDRPRLQAPPTPFNATLSAHRRFAYGSLPLADIKKVKNASGMTVNDVVMALCAGAVRRYLLDAGALPEAPLQAMVPISVRGQGKAGGRRQPGQRDGEHARDAPAHRGRAARGVARVDAGGQVAQRGAGRRCCRTTPGSRPRRSARSQPARSPVCAGPTGSGSR